VEYNLIENIIFEDDNIIVVNKVSNLPTVPLKNNDGKLTLLDMVEQYCPQVRTFVGYSAHEGGVLHRLDTPTSGLVLIAKNKKSFDFLREKQKENLFTKRYGVKSVQQNQLLDGFKVFPYDNVVNSKEVTITSLFRHYGKGRKSVRPVLEDYPKQIVAKASSTFYSTHVRYIKVEDGIYYFNCSLTNGFRHQIRVHLAWSGYPLLGDVLYGAKKNSQFGLNCYSISFIDPASQVEKTVNLKEDVL
jgi:23S rRNA pseudouridine1911/1915/1917 synthase